MKSNKNICHVPVVGYMVQDGNGHWYMDESHSQWADIPADTIARFVIRQLGGSIPGIDIEAAPCA